MAIERHQRWGIVASIVAIAFCLVAVQRAYRGTEMSEAVTRVYFSDDDGKTYFADGVEKGLNFPHEGKQACRAYVYRCDSGKAFVAYLGRHAPNRAPTPSTPDPRYLGKDNAAPGEIEIKRPGDEKWVSLGSPQGQEIVRSLCSSGIPEAVLP